MPDPGVRPDLGQRRDADAPGHAHAAQVVADEVDDHHVLRAVLLRRLELGARVGRARALDRIAPHRAAAAGEEQLGRQARHGAPGPGHERGAVGRQRGRGGREEVERVALEPALEPQAEVGLEQVAGGDPRAARLHERGVRARRRRPRPVARRERARRRRVRERRGERVAAARQRRLALRRDQRLEPPPAGGIAAQHVVVVRERAVGQRHGPRRRRVAGLDAVARLEAQEPEPAAAHGAGRGRHGRHRVQQREPVVVRARGADGIRPEDRAAARPGAEQRERPVRPAQDPHGVGRRHVGLERFAEEPGTHPRDPRGRRAGGARSRRSGRAPRPAPRARPPTARRTRARAPRRSARAAGRCARAPRR